MAQAGWVKVSYRVVVSETTGETWAATGLLETAQEWEEMSKAYYADPFAGYHGKFLTIPKGVRVVALRLETVPGLEGA